MFARQSAGQGMGMGGKLPQQFSTGHEDIIQDVAADFHGDRIATCSADQCIRIWERAQGTAAGEWVCTAKWKAHSGIIYRVAWAHPEFGRVLASCSSDHRVVVWTETEGDSGRSEWVARTDLVDSKEDVTCVEFAPPHQGLHLAVGSSLGGVRVYEATDLVSLASWQVIGEFEATSKNGGGCACIAWNPSPFDRPMIAVGSTTEPVVKVFEHNEGMNRWDLLGTLSGHTAPVLDVAWSPNIGRAYHLIATASRDFTTRIWKVYPHGQCPTSSSPSPRPSTLAAPSQQQQPQQSQQQQQQSQAVDRFSVECTTLEQQHFECWRVQWNVTGTILACSADDGTVRTWKSTSRGTWEPLSVIQSQQK